MGISYQAVETLHCFVCHLARYIAKLVAPELKLVRMISANYQTNWLQSEHTVRFIAMQKVLLQWIVQNRSQFLQLLNGNLFDKFTATITDALNLEIYADCTELASYFHKSDFFCARATNLATHKVKLYKNNVSSDSLSCLCGTIFVDDISPLNPPF